MTILRNMSYQLKDSAVSIWNELVNGATASEVVSASDKRAMERRCATGQTIVVENGVNPESYPLLARPREGGLLFAGAFDYFPNLDAAQFLVRDILLHVWRAAPATEVFLAGSNDRAQVNEHFLKALGKSLTRRAARGKVELHDLTELPTPETLQNIARGENEP